MTRETLTDELGQKESALQYNNPENLPGYEQRVGVLQQRLAPNTSVGVTAENPSGEFNPTVAPGSMDMFTPPQYTGTVPGTPEQQMLPNMPPGAPLPTAPVTAPATPVADPRTSGGNIAAFNNGQQQLTGVNAPKDSGAIIAGATNPAAKAMSGQDNSMAKDGIANMLVGVTGSKRMVGVY